MITRHCVPFLLGLGLPLSALAEGYDLDPELVQNGFSFHAMPGLDSPIIDGEAGMRVGTLVQLEQDPLVLILGEGDEAAIVSSRGDVQLGLSYDWNKRFSTRFVLPLAFQGGGDVPDLAAAGFGMRNMSLGGRVALAGTDFLHVAARADVTIPSGTRNRYMGEGAPRVGLGFLVAGDVGPLELSLDAGYSGATTVETDYDLTMGSEAIANAGLRYQVLEDRFSAGAIILSHSGAKTSLQPGGARVEALAVAQAWFGPSLQLDLGVGRGLTHGYGTTGARFLLGVTWIKPAFVPELIPIEVEDDPNALTLNGRRIEAELPDEPPEEEIEWKQGELARVEVQRKTIEIRDDIKFAVGTSRILPESLPVLDQVAELMASYWQIDHLVIDGHASEEGEFDINFELSIERARAIYKALVEAGVHPARMSFRGFGEVDPKDRGESEADLAKNRRVEFHIVRQLEPLEVPPKYPDTVRLPWTGETVRVRQAAERLLGQDMQFQTPAGPDDDDEAVDMLKGMLDEDDEHEKGAPAKQPDASRLREYQEEMPDFDDLLDDDEQPAEDRP